MDIWIIASVFVGFLQIWEGRDPEGILFVYEDPEGVLSGPVGVLGSFLAVFLVIWDQDIPEGILGGLAGLGRLFEGLKSAKKILFLLNYDLGDVFSPGKIDPSVASGIIFRHFIAHEHVEACAINAVELTGEFFNMLLFPAAAGSNIGI